MEEKIEDIKIKKSLAEEVESFCKKWNVAACYICKKFTTYDFETIEESVGWVGTPYFFITEPNDEGLLLLADFLKYDTVISNICKWYKKSFVEEFKQLAKKVREEYDTRRDKKSD